MRRILIGLTLALFAMPALAQNKDVNLVRCLSDNADISIDGCTALIQSGHETTANLAKSYFRRGLAYLEKDLYDQAIPDFTQAIALKPDYIGAYDQRGVAYEHKGLRDQAVADYRMALKFRPKDRIAQHGLKRLGITP